MNHHDHGHNHKDQYVFGSVTVGTKGQIVIPKEAREIFEIKQGDKLLVLGDKNKGLALVKTSILKGITKEFFDTFNKGSESNTEQKEGGVK